MQVASPCSLSPGRAKRTLVVVGRKLKRDAAAAGAAVLTTGVPGRVKACAAATQSNAVYAQRIIVDQPAL